MTVSRLLFNQLLVYCRLSLTKLMIVFFQVIFLLGLMIRQPLSSCSRVVIIGTLTNTHSVQDDPVPCLDPWAGSRGVF